MEGAQVRGGGQEAFIPGTEHWGEGDPRRGSRRVGTVPESAWEPRSAWQGGTPGERTQTPTAAAHSPGARTHSGPGPAPSATPGAAHEEARGDRSRTPHPSAPAGTQGGPGDVDTPGVGGAPDSGWGALLLPR